MPFDAGSIASKLTLDLSDYAHGILQAQAVSAVFPPMVIEFMENPLLGFIEVAKEAARFVVEAVEQIAASFHAVGLAAERAGVEVEWLSRLQASASTAGVGLEQLVTGFKVLEQRAEQAAEGDEHAIKGFERLGISAQEAGKLMSKPQELFQRVKEGIDQIQDPSLRTAAALGVLGRQGFNLAPVLTQSSAEATKFQDIIADLGGTVTEQDAEMGKGFAKLETIASAAWTGIKKAIAEPILEAFGASSDELVAKIEELSHWIREGIGGAFTVLAPIVKGVWETLSGLAEVVGSVLVPAFEILTPVLRVVGEILGFIFKLVGEILSGIGMVLRATGFLGMTDPGGQRESGGGSKGGGSKLEFHAHIDGIDDETASTEAARLIKPHIVAAHEKQKSGLQGLHTQQKVARTLGGKTGRP